MSVQVLEDDEPDFISFLFSTELKHDFYFLVGNKDLVKPEKIGVVKAMLMAHSPVWRLGLGDSKLADKEQVALPDIYPDTFRNLLRYVYGYDTTASLNFNETDDLFSVAHKYNISKLKNKLATKLMDLLNPENICSLLNNPAIYTVLELDNAITKILRFETDKVLASPMFLEIERSGFVKLLEQDSLNVPEIELWKAALKWAKHNVGSEDGKELRKQMATITQHIRICTLPTEQFLQEVVPTRVLSNDEIAAVCMAIGKQEKQDELTEFSNEIIPRHLVYSMYKYYIHFSDYESSYCSSSQRDFTMEVVTQSYAIELLPLEFFALNPTLATAASATCPVGCSITITRVTDDNHASTVPSVTIRFKKLVVYRMKFEIPLTSNGRNVTLSPNSKYIVKMVFDDAPRRYEGPRNEFHNNHLSVYWSHSPLQGGSFSSPIDQLAYRC